MTRSALGRRAVALTLTMACLTGISAGAAASHFWPGDGQIVGSSGRAGTPAVSLPVRSTSPTGSGMPSAVPTTTAQPITTRTTLPPTRTPATTAPPPRPISQALLRLNDWREAGLPSVASAEVLRTLSRCQDRSLGAMAGVRGTRYSTVASRTLTGAEAVVETGTPAQADAVLRALVSWRDTCDPRGPGEPNPGFIAVSELASVRVPAPDEAYAWTFTMDLGGYEGVTRIEKLVVARSGNRVALVVVTKEVAQGAARTFGGVDMAGLARSATERLT